MPATVTHIKKQFRMIERFSAEGDDRKLVTIARDAMSRHWVDGTVDWQAAWKDLCASAEKADVAHALPGSVGKKYAKKKTRTPLVTIELSHPQAVIFGAFAGAMVLVDDPPFLVAEDGGRITLRVFDTEASAEVVLAVRERVVSVEGTRDEKHAALFGLDEVLEQIKATTTQGDEDAIAGND
jgi:hypothetical protein